MLAIAGLGIAFNAKPVLQERASGQLNQLIWMHYSISWPLWTGAGELLRSFSNFRILHVVPRTNYVRFFLLLLGFSIIGCTGNRPMI